MLKRLGIAVLLTLTPMMAMHNWMLNISDIDVEVKLDFDLGQFNENYALESYFLGVGHLSVEDNQMTYGSYLVINDVPEKENTRLGIGFKVISTKHHNSDETFLATPFGFVYEYAMESESENPAYVQFSGYYAPGALSFSDARAYIEGRAQVEVEPIEHTRAFLGYRYIKTSYEISGSTEFNNVVYGGVQVGF